MQVFDLDRRDFFRWSLKALGAIGAIGVFYPVIRFLGGNIDAESLASTEKISGAGNVGLKPAESTDSNSVEIDASTVPEGSGMMLTLGSVPIILVRNNDRWRAFNATCSHLGCLVKWDQTGQRFVCPCHGGMYNSDGRVTAGPPPASLVEQHVTLAGNRITITRA